MLILHLALLVDAQVHVEISSFGHLTSAAAATFQSLSSFLKSADEEQKSSSIRKPLMRSESRQRRHLGASPASLLENDKDQDLLDRSSQLDLLEDAVDQLSAQEEFDFDLEKRYESKASQVSQSQVGGRGKRTHQEPPVEVEPFLPKVYLSETSTTTTSASTSTTTTTTTESTATTTTRAVVKDVRLPAANATVTPVPAPKKLEESSEDGLAIYLPVAAGIVFAIAAGGGGWWYYQRLQKTKKEDQDGFLVNSRYSSRPSVQAATARLDYARRSQRLSLKSIGSAYQQPGGYTNASYAAEYDRAYEGIYVPPTEPEAPEIVANKLKVTLKLQAMFRGWKVRKELKKGSFQEDHIRAPKERQVVFLQIEAVSGANMPNFKLMGGCDPFLEFRTTNDEKHLSNSQQEVSVKPDAEQTVECQAKMSEMNPTWNETLKLLKVCHAQDHFLHVVLWNYSFTGNEVLAHASLAIPRAIDGLKFNAKEEPKKASHSLSFKSLLPQGGPKTKAKISVAYVEALQYKIVVKSASRLPQMKTFGSIDAYIELRVVSSDPRTATFEKHPPQDCIWSAMTKHQTNNVDPTWKEAFTPLLPGDPKLTLQLILWDSNSPLPDTPVAHALLELKDVASLKQGGADVSHKLKFTAIRDVQCPAEIKKSTLKITITSDIIVG